MITDNVKLNELTVEDWLESYRLRTRHLINRGVTGPLNPDQDGAARDVVPGVYNNWHYDALAMLQLLAKVLELQMREKQHQEREKQLHERIRLLERVLLEDKSDDAP